MERSSRWVADEAEHVGAGEQGRAKMDDGGRYNNRDRAFLGISFVQPS